MNENPMLKDGQSTSVRRCSKPINYFETDSGTDVEICGWPFFDEVVLLVDVEKTSVANSEPLRFNGLACRSCGTLQPDGIPEEVLSQLKDVEIAKGRG